MDDGLIKRNIGEIMLAIFFMQAFAPRCVFLKRQRDDKRGFCGHLDCTEIEKECLSMTCPRQSDLIKSCELNFDEAHKYDEDF